MIPYAEAKFLSLTEGYIVDYIWYRVIDYIPQTMYLTGLYNSPMPWSTTYFPQSGTKNLASLVH
jgi:hypothetical protein